MSEDTKVIVRPKVRFSQFSNNTEDGKQADNRHKYENVSRTNAPKIRSIVTLRKPIKIIEPKNSIDAHDKEIPQCNPEKELLTHHNDTVSDKIQSGSRSDNNVSKDKTKIMRNTNVLQNTKKDCKTSQLEKSVCTRNDTLERYKKNVSHKGKENKVAVFNKQPEFDKDIRGKTKINKNVKEKTESSRYTRSDAHEKLKIFTSNKSNMQMKDTACSKSPKVAKARCASNLKKPVRQTSAVEICSARSAVSTVMPCYKYSTNMPKSKTSPVKKTILRNVTGPKIKTSIGSGVFRKKQDISRVGDGNKKFVGVSDIAAENFAQPEYNSIMCTVDALEELKQQKVVTDVKHLPPAQKNFISGKISTALDFPLDEVVFKNLVDLSINDKELPCAITRSKDPEPRQKDIVPKLSDFFVPERAKEICTAVQIKPRLPKIDDNWNPFQISDMIFDWKCSLDDME